ncbi:hypothetical protein BWI95_22540 (plasmid) [Kosakonia cowanii JCM 10956 = DSM 18146]|uniref:Uncharacterized protein n=1 Tax=Kosakonia cowanii JCM 10956 = DSM 18146 TaxID=1300165 RepID=A0A830ZDH8_9ENTR|nr:hypothetical protein [Kosakonia cowanii]APZ07822.1 hypothetical protein BWI95_22540 [Kosakonia cowanii JCM 10956 = DSM 18146]
MTPLPLWQKSLCFRENGGSFKLKVKPGDYHSFTNGSTGISLTAAEYGGGYLLMVSGIFILFTTMAVTGYLKRQQA